MNILNRKITTRLPGIKIDNRKKSELPKSRKIVIPKEQKNRKIGKIRDLVPKKIGNTTVFTFFTEKSTKRTTGRVTLETLYLYNNRKKFSPADKAAIESAYKDAIKDGVDPKQLLALKINDGNIVIATNIKSKNNSGFSNIFYGIRDVLVEGKKQKALMVSFEYKGKKYRVFNFTKTDKNGNKIQTTNFQVNNGKKGWQTIDLRKNPAEFKIFKELCTTANPTIQKDKSVPSETKKNISEVAAADRNNISADKYYNPEKYFAKVKVLKKKGKSEKSTKIM